MNYCFIDAEQRLKARFSSFLRFSPCSPRFVDSPERAIWGSCILLRCFFFFFIFFSFLLFCFSCYYGEYQLYLPNQHNNLTNFQVPHHFQQLPTHGQSCFTWILIHFLTPCCLETKYRHYVTSSKIFHIVSLKHKMLSEKQNYSILMPKNLKIP